MKPMGLDVVPRPRPWAGGGVPDAFSREAAVKLSPMRRESKGGSEGRSPLPLTQRGRAGTQQALLSQFPRLHPPLFCRPDPQAAAVLTVMLTKAFPVSNPFTWKQG